MAGLDLTTNPATSGPSENSEQQVREEGYAGSEWLGWLHDQSQYAFSLLVPDSRETN